MGAGSDRSCSTVLPPLILVRSASVRWVGRRDELFHHGDELGPLALLQPRMFAIVVADAGMAAAL